MATHRIVLGRPFAAAVFGILVACAGCDGDASRALDSFAATPQAEPGGRPAGPVVAGIDVLLRDSLALVRGKRLGLITNQTGLGSGRTASGKDTLVETMDLLFDHPDLKLVALYSPEHGLAGQAEAGERVATGRHPRTDLPIYSLYGATNEPLPSMLEGVDVLLFDIQDVGARYYTYVWTMALAMKAAGAAGIPFVVLDRPDPIGGALVQGTVLDTAFASFIGLHPVPMRYGMTVGEVARMARGEWGVRADLHVIPMDGWRRDMTYDATGLAWTAPSPNMPSVESALHYPGTCLFEGTNLSVGRGTDRPFQWIGAPWIDGAALAAALNAYGLPGIRFEAATFTPSKPGDAKWPSTEVHGVRFVATDLSVYDPTKAAVAALVETRRMAGANWKWITPHFDQLAGTDRLRLMIEEGRSVDEIVASWEAPLTAFRRLRERYLLYP